MKSMVGLLLVLIFVYNIIIGYWITLFTPQAYKLYILLLVSIDYVIIFYFALNATKRVMSRPARKGRKSGSRHRAR